MTKHEYKVNKERLLKTIGRLCPCLVPSRETSVHKNICPCTEFVDTGKCRCLLFVEK